MPSLSWSWQKWMLKDIVLRRFPPYLLLLRQIMPPKWKYLFKDIHWCFLQAFEVSNLCLYNTPPLPPTLFFNCILLCPTLFRGSNTIISSLGTFCIPTHPPPLHPLKYDNYFTYGVSDLVLNFLSFIFNIQRRLNKFKRHELSLNETTRF